MAPATISRLADVPDKLFDVFACVRGGLHPEEPRIATAQTHQLFVRALLGEASVLEEDDPVGSPPDRLTPASNHLPRAVSYPAGSVEISSSDPACLLALTTASRLPISGTLPSPMFSLAVAW